MFANLKTIGTIPDPLERLIICRLCSNVETTFTEEAVDIGIPETQYLHHKGLILYVRQMCVLMRRQMRFLMYQKYSFIILQVLVPFAIMFLMGFLLRGGQANPQYQNKTTLNLEMNDEKPIKTILLRVNSPEFRTNRKLDWLNTGAYKNVVFQVTNDVANTEFRASQKDTSSGIDSSELKEYFMGVELNNTNAKVKYTTKVRHAAPVAINLLSNILATQYFPKADGRTITTNHQPLDDENRPLSLPTLEMPKDITQCVMWICIHVIIIKSTLINSVALPATEREAGTRHIHLMSGCAPAVHWLTTVLTHTLLYAVVLMLPITLIFHIDNIEKTFNNNAFIGVMLLILLLGSISFLFLCYLVTFVFSKRGSGLLLTHIIILFGTIPAVVLFMPNITGNDADKRMKIPSLIIYYTVSPCTMTLAALKAASVARLKAMCHLNLELCPVLLVHIFELSEFFSPENKGFDPKMCCLHRKSTLCTVCMNENGVGKELIILFVQIIIYGAFVILAEYGIFNGIHDRICNIRYKPKPSRFHDTNVVVEKLYVSERMKEPRSQLIEGSDGMLVNNIHKNYFNICKKSVNAVRGISFSVKKGECFGLLGVNGAGKSTTFKMISAEEVTTRGNIYTNGEILKWPRSSKYIRSLGYCPQFFGLDEFMTGRENLATLLTMHGLNTKDIITETEAWINAVGLERYRDVLVLDYSGGCMRRLATAAALSSGAPITLLDEPTAGVDVSARRRMWVALRKGLRQNRAIIITSHSMDEMEALCNRIVIMSAGEIATLGSAPALRAAYASGHALSIKINSAGTNLEKLPELKNSLDKKFNCTLTDEHATMLSYHINETMHYSVIFKELEKLKNEYPEVMEDYSVTETTLEEVFLSFAKPVQEEQQPNKKQKKK